MSQPLQPTFVLSFLNSKTWMDSIKPMTNTVILRHICSGFVLLFLSLFFFLFVCLFVCFLFFPSTFLLVLHAIFLLLFLHSFITYLFLFLYVFIPYFYFFLFSLLFTSSFYFFLVDKRVSFVFWQYLVRICFRTVFIWHFCDLVCYTEGIMVSNFTAVPLSLLCRGLFRIYRFPKFVLIRIK